MNDITALMASMKAAAEKAIADEGLTWWSEEQLESDYGLPLHPADAKFIALASPENVLALIEALEKAQKSNQFLKDQLSELANFNPDWDKLEASYESWREIAAELLVAKDRIAELESRTVTVKLPERQEPTSSGHYGEGYLVQSNTGSALDYEDTVDALRAAGIQVIEGEE